MTTKIGREMTGTTEKNRMTKRKREQNKCQKERIKERESEIENCQRERIKERKN
jgi:hypothetical protein